MVLTEEEKLIEQVREQKLIIEGLYQERQQNQEDLECREKEVFDLQNRVEELKRAIVNMAVKLK